jgi:hypothetical protein
VVVRVGRPRSAMHPVPVRPVAHPSACLGRTRIWATKVVHAAEQYRSLCGSGGRSALQAFE